MDTNIISSSSKVSTSLVTNLLSSAKTQITRNALPLITTVGLAGVIILVLLVVGRFRDIPLDKLTRDAASIEDTPFYYGMLTTLGIMLWACAFGAACLNIFILRGISKFKAEWWFAVASAFIGGLLMLDDAFLLHEEVLPEILSIPEGFVYVGYVALIVLYGIIFFRQILRSDYIFLLAMGAFFALSISVDRSFIIPWDILVEQFNFNPRNLVFIEDGLKFIGIGLWMVYMLRYLLKMLPMRYEHLEPVATK